jgi:hypothetical protein
MILLNHNLSNDVILTLQENSQLWQVSGITPYYLFSFSSETTNKIVNFAPDDIAAFSAKSRYNEFTIIESGGTQTLTGSCVVNLNPSDWWTYVCYEQTNQYNLNPLNTFGIVETGKVLISGITTQQEQYDFYTGNTLTFSTYVR